MKLYEMTQNYEEVWQLLENEDVDVQTIEDTLSSIEDAFDAKIESIGKFILHLNKDAEFIKSEEDRLAKRRKALEGKSDWLKKYAFDNMTIAGKDKIKTPIVTVAIQSASPSVEIKPDAKIPRKFMVVIPSQKNPDKKAILEALKAGEKVRGAALKQTKYLRVR